MDVRFLFIIIIITNVLLACFLGMWDFVFKMLIMVNYIGFQKWKQYIPEKQWTWSQYAVYMLDLVRCEHEMRMSISSFTVMFLSGVRTDSNIGLDSLWSVLLSVIWKSFK